MAGLVPKQLTVYMNLLQLVNGEAFPLVAWTDPRDLRMMMLQSFQTIGT